MWTKGPLDWMAVGANASGGHHVYIIDAKGRKIAACWGEAAEKQANAVLWGAAPDLAEAGSGLLNCVDGQHDQEWLERAKAAMRAALRKAGA